MNEWMLLILFIVSAVLGYVIIRNVPALMHTPLMSGMNALSGITVIGAMVVVADVAACMILTNGNSGLKAKVLGIIAVVLAMVNVAGGFALTHRMLRMIAGKKSTDKPQMTQPIYSQEKAEEDGEAEQENAGGDV